MRRFPTRVGVWKCGGVGVCRLPYSHIPILPYLHTSGSRAEKIRSAYVPTFLNPKTGIVAGWKDADGNLHDYSFVFVNGIALGPEGFHLESWSPLRGKDTRLNLRYMGAEVRTIR